MSQAVCPKTGRPTIALSQVTAGQCCTVASIDADAEQCMRLAGMGVCVGCQLQSLRHGDPVIFDAAGTRVGVGPKLAAMIQVTFEGQEPDAAA